MHLTCLLTYLLTVAWATAPELNTYLHALDGLNEKMLKRITHTLDGMDAEMVADKAELEAELEKDTAMTQAFSDVDYDDVATDEEGYESSGSAGHPHRMDSPAGGTLHVASTFEGASYS